MFMQSFGKIQVKIVNTQVKIAETQVQIAETQVRVSLVRWGETKKAPQKSLV